MTDDQDNPTLENADPAVNEAANSPLDELFDLEETGTTDACVKFLQAMIAGLRQHQREDGIEIDGLALVYTGTKRGGRLFNVGCTEMLAGQAIELLNLGAGYYAEQLDTFMHGEDPDHSLGVQRTPLSAAIEGSLESH